MKRIALSGMTSHVGERAAALPQVCSRAWCNTQARVDGEELALAEQVRKLLLPQSFAGK